MASTAVLGQQKLHGLPEPTLEVLFVVDRLARHHHQADRLVNDLLAPHRRHAGSVTTSAEHAKELSPAAVQNVRDLLRRPIAPPPWRTHQPQSAPAHPDQRQTRMRSVRQGMSAGGHARNASWTPKVPANLPGVQITAPALRENLP